MIDWGRIRNQIFRSVEPDLVKMVTLTGGINDTWQQKSDLKVEYLGEFELIYETAQPVEQGPDRVVLCWWKNQ
jgi:hypothetical protein